MLSTQDSIMLGQSINLVHAEFLQKIKGSVTTTIVVDNENKEMFKKRVMFMYRLIQELKLEMENPTPRLPLTTEQVKKNIDSTLSFEGVKFE